MAGTSKSTEQRYARHVPTGQVCDVNAIPDGLRPGPWQCRVRGCDVPYDGIRNKTQTVRGPRSGAFVIRKLVTHDLAFPHDRVPQHPTTVRIDDGSRLDSHHLRGFDLPPAEPTASAGESTGVTRTTKEWGEDVHSAAGLLEEAARMAADPERALRKEYWLGDTRYRWDDLAYDTTHASFTRLKHRIGAQVNVGRVYFVCGYAKYQPYPENRDSSLLLLRLLSRPPAGEESGAAQIEVWVHMPNTDEYRARTATIRHNTPLAIVTNRRDPRHWDNPELLLSRPEQLEIIHQP